MRYETFAAIATNAGDRVTALVLVVDDIVSNVMVLEAQLRAAYFEVITCSNGIDALARVHDCDPDILLLDVMMPGMDGFEVCRRIKSNSKTAHIPVIMVTALDQTIDRVAGFNAGADDFLTKPVDDAELIVRLRNLVHLKRMTDELRVRQATCDVIGGTGSLWLPNGAPQTGRVLLVDDRPDSIARYISALPFPNQTTIVDSVESALLQIRLGVFDLGIISLSMGSFDGLRLCSRIRSLPEGNGLPIMVVVGDGERRKLTQALKLGVDDYMMRPVNTNELSARVRMQLRKKYHTERLHECVERSLELAGTDELTGLHNRHHLERNLDILIQSSNETGRAFVFLVLDIDHFKVVNDTYGHDTGDEVLRECAERISGQIRDGDMACRYGGEEFVILLPDTDIAFASVVAERLRVSVETTPFVINCVPDKLNITISIGIAGSETQSDTSESLLRRADQALYRAKREGRNRVIAHAA